MPPRTLFADTFYWIALFNPRDARHAAAVAYGSTLGSTRQVTTDLVLTEFLNHFSGGGPKWRSRAVLFVRDVLVDPDVEVLTTTATDFIDAVDFYDARPDKGYSLTDCRSMLAMKGPGITDALTNDRHFTQEGFTILFPGP